MGSSGNACQRNANRSVTEMTRSNPTEPKIDWPASRLRRHADYQRVYQASRKQFAKQMSYFFALRPALGPDGTSVRGASSDAARVGLTVGKAMGKAVDRNRIAAHARSSARQLPLLAAPVDLVLHPRRSVIDLDFATLEREVAAVFGVEAEAVRRQLPLLAAPVDVVLHPRQSVLDLDFATLEREVAAVFRAVQKAAEKQLPAQTEPAKT